MNNSPYSFPDVNGVMRSTAELPDSFRITPGRVLQDINETEYVFFDRTPGSNKFPVLATQWKGPLPRGDKKQAH